MERIFCDAILFGVKVFHNSDSVTLEIPYYFLHKDLSCKIFFLSSCCHTAAVMYCAWRRVWLDMTIR